VIKNYRGKELERTHMTTLLFMASVGKNYMGEKK
jgi:hypothetical protein